MKIELKSIQHFEKMSEETEAFTANVYIDGYKAAFARNDGHGGSTNFQGYDTKGWQLLAQAEQYCQTLPPRTYEVSGEPFTLKMNLENFIDDCSMII